VPDKIVKVSYLIGSYLKLKK